MANFSGTQNLLAFKGSKLMTGIDQQHPDMVYVVIPVPYNDIQITRDGTYANVSVYMSETGEKFRQACIQRRQQSGDPMEGYTPPSHQAEVSFSKEFRERALAAAKKRILAEHPEWAANPDLQNPDYNRDLKNAMYDAVRIRLGSFYARFRQQPAGAWQQPAGTQSFSGQAQAWTPPQTDQYGNPVGPAGGYSPEDDDLPF